MSTANPPYTIPFNKPGMAGNELEYIAEAIRGGHISGDGNYTRKCSTLLEEALGVPKVLLTTSCTHALEMAALLLDLQPGDEVIVPSFTFVSTVNAFVLRGVKPVFADIRPDTLNLDESQLERLITPRTRASWSWCITPAWAARWTPSWRSPLDTVWQWSRTTPTGCLAGTTGKPWAPSAAWRRSASTRPRTSPAARAERC